MNEREIESYKKAGKIAGETVKFARGFIKQGILLREIADKIESKINELGGQIAFPANLSIDEIAAHYTPSANDETKANGLLSVDLGVEINGCIADTAFSVDLSENKEHEKMIELNKEVLELALKTVKVGSKIGEIGTAIQDRVEEYNKKNGTNFSIVKNLTGHSLGKNLIHSGLTIPNYINKSETSLEDVAIAIEPFLTTGAGEIYEGKAGEIFMLQSDGQTRDREAREILKFIKENYKTKPFCKRWLVKAGLKKVDFSLSILTKQGILHNFPILIEKSKKPVSQEEHTVLITDKAIVTTR